MNELICRPEDGEVNEMTLPSDTAFEIQAIAVLGRARYLSITEDPFTSERGRISFFVANKEIMMYCAIIVCALF